MSGLIDMNILWLAAILVFVILESVTYQLVSLWFAFGAAAGLAASALGAGTYAQIITFLIASALFLAALRPLSVKLVKNQDLKTNVESLIGKRVLVTKEVNNVMGEGEGKINGMVWTVRSADDSVIACGETPEIVKIEGVKLIVKREE